MAEFHELYQRAQYYDIVFQRDISEQIAFIAALAERRLGRKLASALEIACGPGYHARALAAQGVEAWGLDLRPEMIEYAAAGAAADGVNVHWLVADMRHYELPKPVDCAIAVFDAIDCLLTNDELVAHFARVGAQLTPGGFYLVDMEHPRNNGPFDYGTYRYEGERDGTHIAVQWAVNDPMVDPVTNIAEVQTRITVTRDGRAETILDTAKERFASAQEYAALASLSGKLRLAETYGDFRLDQPFDNSAGSRRMILIFEPQ